MQIANILSKLSHEKEAQDNFLALQISSEFVIAALWTISEGKTKLIKQSSYKEWDVKNELLLAIDACLSDLLSAGTKVKGVIFGLEESWVNGDIINTDKQEILKEICGKQELKPLGFVVITESLIQYLKIIEGVPLSAILIKLELSQAVISLVKLGKIIGTETVGRSEDLSSDLKEALVRFGDIDSFPARILLFDGYSDFEQARQELVSYDWQNELPFFHIPKVEVLEQFITIKALTIAGGSEIAKSLGFEIKTENEKPLAVFGEDKKITASGEKEEPATEVPEEVNQSEDKIFEESVTPDLKNSETETENNYEHESLGFSQEDVLENVENTQSITVLPEISSEPAIDSPVDIGERPINKFSLAYFKNKFHWFKLKPRVAGYKKWWLIILPITFLLIFFIGVFAAYWYLPKAEITLYFNKERTHANLQIAVDANAKQVSTEEKILPVTKKNIKVSGSSSIPTTGESQVGERAKGTVIVYNKTEVTKTFEKGDSLGTDNGLIFTFDNEVKVASRSAEESLEGEKIVYGKSSASITAAKIGPEYNLVKDKELSILDYSKSNFVAVIDNDLGGGTKRDVSAVSEEDQTELAQLVKKDLLEKAQKQIEETADNQKVIANAQEMSVVSENYDKEVGDEADSLNLELEAELEAYLYRSSDLDLLVAESLLSLIPKDYVIEETSITKSEFDTQSENEFTLNLEVEALVLPKLSINNVKQNIKGKYPEVVNEYFNTLPSFSRAETKIYPNFLPAKLKTFPRKIERIDIKLKPEQ